MNEFTLLSEEETLEASEGILVLGLGSFSFSSVETDSRNVKKDTFFVPLIGEFQDGHKYIPQAVEKGASCVFISREAYEKDSEFFVDCWRKNEQVKYIVVENTLTALQNIAEKYVSKFPELIKLAVTGSSGKTTSKEMLYSLLSQKYKVVCNKGNFNSETGLPLSVFNIRKGDELGLFEMGMNRKNEIAEISKVLKAKYALVTNIGTAHIGILGSRENIAEEKSNVFNYIGEDKKNPGIAFIPKDDDFCDFLTKKAENVGGKIIYYGKNCDSSITNVKNLGLKGTDFCIDGFKAHLSLPGEYNFINMTGAVAVAKALGVSSEKIAEGVNNLKPMFGRSQILEGKYTVVQDCYNANPDSMEKAVEFMSSVPAEKGCKKVFVLGDMLELGKDSETEHRKLGTLCAKSDADIVIFAGKETESSFEAAKSALFKGKLFFFAGNDDETIKDIAACIKENAPSESSILIKASRGLKLERISEIILKEE